MVRSRTTRLDRYVVAFAVVTVLVRGSQADTVDSSKGSSSTPNAWDRFKGNLMSSKEAWTKLGSSMEKLKNTLPTHEQLGIPDKVYSKMKSGAVQVTATATNVYAKSRVKIDHGVQITAETATHVYQNVAPKIKTGLLEATTVMASQYISMSNSIDEILKRGKEGDENKHSHSQTTNHRPCSFESAETFEKAFASSAKTVFEQQQCEPFLFHARNHVSIFSIEEINSDEIACTGLPTLLDEFNGVFTKRKVALCVKSHV